jgi:hypothetical protein
MGHPDQVLVQFAQSRLREPASGAGAAISQALTAVCERRPDSKMTTDATRKGDKYIGESWRLGRVKSLKSAQARRDVWTTPDFTVKVGKGHLGLRK